VKSNHQKLIKLLYDHSEMVDRIYNDPSSVNILSVPSELLEKSVVLRLGNIVQLNPFYRQFVNTILLKADYSILFGDYSEHIKEISVLKKRYLESKKYSLIGRIKRLITDLYTSVVLQDTQIEALLYDMSNQISIELEQLIEEAELVLQKVQKLLSSIEKIIKSLDDDLALIHSEISNTIENVKQALEPNLNHIKSHCDKFSELIRMSEEKKALNQKLFSLTAVILQENDKDLIEFLLENQNDLALSINEDIRTIPHKDSDLKKIIQNLNKMIMLPPPKIKKSLKRVIGEPKVIHYINQENIVNDLKKDGCEDLYLFLREHQEIKKLPNSTQEQEAFKLFLLFSFDKEYPITIKDTFNTMNIRSVSWQ